MLTVKRPRTDEEIEVKAGTLVTYCIGGDAYGGYVTDVSRTGYRVFYRLGKPDGTEIKREDGDRVAIRKTTLEGRTVYRSIGASYDALHFGYADDRRDPHF